ncbi:MAG: winged helix DNA-binding protein [Clostridiales bacterium]|nr:winged helix DNA-binding protein [Clostridiales bacterium]
MIPEPIEELWRVLRRFSSLRFTNLPVKLRQGEFATMMFMRVHRERHPNTKSISLNAIAKWHNVSPAMISKICRGIEEKGYIERITDTEDRRGFKFKLTDEGEKVLDKDAKTLDDIMTNVCKKMGKEKMQAVIELNQELCEIAEQEIKLSNLERKDNANV